MIEAAMQENLETITWMDNITRAAALLKLSKVRNMIGYPPNPEYPSSPTAPSLPFPLCPLRAPFLSDVVACSNYTNLQLFPDQFYANVQNANTYAFVKMVNSVCIPLFDSPLSPPLRFDWRNLCGAGGPAGRSECLGDDCRHHQRLLRANSLSSRCFSLSLSFSLHSSIIITTISFCVVCAYA
jgi:hypothetical protein